jgi:two-component system, NarL family, response regulator LiaR
MPVIRVLIAHPHDMIRESLISMIAGMSEMEMVGETANGPEAIRLCDALNPDVLLIGLYLNGLDSLVTTRLIYEKSDRPYIIMIDGLYGEEHEGSARKAGVDAYFTLDASISDIVNEIRTSVP